MTTADEQRPPGGYPWHSVPVVAVTGPSAALHGRRAGLVTRSLATIADVLVVLLILGGGWVAVAATRFLLHPTAFSFPAPEPWTFLLLGLCVQAVYFAVNWAVIGRTYGDQLLGLRVIADRRDRLPWGRSAVRAVLCTVFPIGLLWVLLSTENRSVQDVLLRTSVVYDRVLV